MTDINLMLIEREDRYGGFSGVAEIAQALKDCMRRTEGWQSMSAVQREALDMTQHKIARLLNGDPHHLDGWTDACGYLKLVVNRLERTA